MIFFARHPELGKNYKIKSDQIELKNEWLNYRDRVVRPIIEKNQTGKIIGDYSNTNSQ